MITVSIFLWFLNLAVISLELMGSQEITALCAFGVNMNATPSVCGTPLSGCSSI